MAYSICYFHAIESIDYITIVVSTLAVVFGQISTLLGDSVAVLYGLALGPFIISFYYNLLIKGP